MELFIFDATEKIVLASAGVFFLIQLIYYGVVYSRIARHQRAVGRGEIPYAQEQPPVSILLYAREEGEALRRHLPEILTQEYPLFEVIVIIDGKDDGTEDYLIQMEEKYPHLYHSFIPESSRYISRKKLAVTLGIKASKYDWLMLTEPRCYPPSRQWLKNMARHFTSRTEIVLGYCQYERGKGWFQKRVGFDNLFHGMRYLSAALNGHPYMGIGRNLAYRKELFYRHKVFSAHLHLQRGDDDLFINQVANGHNTRVECSPEAVMQIGQPYRVKDWREEKIGYRSTAKLYRGLSRWLYGAETTTCLCFHGCWMAAVALGAIHFHWMVAVIGGLLFLLRWMMQGIVFYYTTRALGEKRRYFWSLPVFDVCQPMQSLKWKLYCLFRKKSDFLRK